MKLLVAFDMLPSGWEELKSKFDVSFPDPGRDFSQEELLSMIPEYDVLCSVFDIKIGKDIIDAGKKLKLISNYAVGYNNIDIAYAASCGIAVTNTPKSVIEPTADLAMSLIYDVSRKISYWGRKMRDERETLSVNRLSELGTGIHGKTLGIVGMGNIGKALSRRAQAAGMKILYYKRDRYTEKIEKSLNVEYAELEDLLTHSDIVSLHTPYNKKTHHLIGIDELSLMKREAYLINTGRGALVDETALVAALQDKRIAGAGLDVFEHQDIPSRALYEMDNVSLTPHIGTQTHEARMAMLKELTDNVIGFFEGEREVSRIV